jgi:hypothetical protein
MTEALLFVGIGSLLLIAAATLAVATLTFRNARRYVELTEERMEYLREGHAHLLTFLLEERRSLKEELEREREQPLEAQRPAERAGRGRLPPLQRRSGEEFGQEGEQPLEARQEREGRELRTRRGVERRIDQLEQELQVLRDVSQHREVGQESSSPLSKGSFADLPEARGPLGEKTLPTEEAWGAAKTSRPASSPGAPPEDKRPRLAVWHPHPDDDVSPGRASARPARSPSDAPVEMFRRHYDKYLENYEGYVKLAERIYRMRDDAEIPPGSLAEREWEERLRRVNDGIERTTARLDILEEYNPELVTDDRISHRASIAQSHSELERSGRSRSKRS